MPGTIRRDPLPRRSSPAGIKARLDRRISLSQGASRPGQGIQAARITEPEEGGAVSTPDCGPHCRPASARDPYGWCCSCSKCHCKPVKRSRFGHLITRIARALALAFVLESIAILMIAAEQELVHHVIH